VSHYKERNEKNCLNCHTVVEGRFCQVCGQENIETKETFWGLLTHFAYDITHFDGKFFSTAKQLLFKPGKLSLAYITGKRISYLHPIRMYVFTSAFFFIIFFSLFSASGLTGADDEVLTRKKNELETAKENLQKDGLESKDTIIKFTAARVLTGLQKELDDVNKQIAAEKEAETKEDKLTETITDSLNQKISKKGNDTKYRYNKKPLITFDTSGTTTKEDVEENNKDIKYTSLIAYNKMQEALPQTYKDGFWKKFFVKQVINVFERGNKNGEHYAETFLDHLLHSFPKMLFISLPLFALIMKWMYRRRKDLFYSDHVIYTIHLYCATFIFMLVWFAFSKLQHTTGWNVFFGWLQFILFILVYIYQYKAMRVFYGNRRGKTILKFLIVNFLSTIMMVLLLIIFSIISVAQANNATH
jgi:Protein of unknown function (DUF3667)